jgi:hypothetical protein
MSSVLHRTAGDLLRMKFSFATPALNSVSAQLWQAEGLAQRYPHYLSTMHGVLRASVPLMELAADLCLTRDAEDPVAAPLRTHLLRHAAEEQDHDAWLLADLAVLGHDPAEVAARQPAPAVARLVGPQYYWIRHDHPVALLGYMAVLEAHAPSPRLLEHIALATGFPDAALGTVRAHAAIDPGHADAVFDLCDRLPLTGRQLDAIAVSGLATAVALLDVYTHVIRTASDGGER